MQDKSYVVVCLDCGNRYRVATLSTNKVRGYHAVSPPGQCGACGSLFICVSAPLDTIAVDKLLSK